MKNIYILDEHQSSKRNGIGTYLKELIYFLQKMDVNICLISFNADEKEFSIRTENNIKRILFPPFQKGGFLDYHFSITTFFRLYMEDSSNNIFFFNHSPCEGLLKAVKENFPLSKCIFVIHDFGWTSRLLGNSRKLEKIISEREDKIIKEKYGSLLNYFDEEKRMYNIADATLSLCDNAYDAVINIYQSDKRKIYMIHNGLRQRDGINISEDEKVRLRKQLNISEDEKIILFVGRLTDTKGIRPLLKAFCRVINKYPKARLIIAGSTHNKDWHTQLCLLGKKALTKITFAEQLSPEEMNEWYKITDIGLASAHVEQCSYSGIEMLMYGLPVIASDGFGVQNMFVDNYNAKVAKIGNDDNLKEYEINLSKAILELLKSNKLRENLSGDAVESYRNKYTIDVMQKEYLALFANI